MPKPSYKKPATAGAFGTDKGVGSIPGSNLQTAMISKLRLTKLPTKPFNPRTKKQSDAKKQLEVNDLCFLIGPAGTGKCVAWNSQVLTASGLKPIEELAHEAPENEALEQSIAVQTLAGVRDTSHVYNGGFVPTLRVTTQQGYSLEGTPEHPLLTVSEDGSVKWIRMSEIVEGTYLAMSRGTKLYGDQTFIGFQSADRKKHDYNSVSVTYNEMDDELAYLLGLLTGDGCLRVRNSTLLTTEDEEIADFFSAFGSKLGLTSRTSDNLTRILPGKGLYDLLMHLGMKPCLAHHKEIPSAILSAPEFAVKAFLQGLFDADGTVERRSGYVSLTSTSETLADQVHLLLLNAGIVARKRVVPTSHRVAYTLDITGRDAELFYEEIGFRLTRKTDLRKCAAVHNTNVDIVPNVGALLRGACATVTLSRASHKILQDYKSGRRQPSREKLQKLVALIASADENFEGREKLEKLLDPTLAWSKVTKIEAGEAQVYDLTIPVEHNFVANGFVSHNTFMAAAQAVEDVITGRATKIILTRAAVEAGESIGFLPGDVIAKMKYYVQPMLDALGTFWTPAIVEQLIATNVIQMIPMTYLRGNSIADAVIIVDEFQNATPSQGKLALTRAGDNCRILVTADPDQCDLPPEKESAIQDLWRFEDISGIAFIDFDTEDVVRSVICRKVLDAYKKVEHRYEAA